MSLEHYFRIQQLNLRYAEAIDSDRLEAWPDLFVEAGRYAVTTADNFERGLPLCLIRATSRAMMRDRVHSLRDANVYEPQRYRHLIGAPLVTRQQDDGTMDATTSFAVVRTMQTGESSLFASGRYLDIIAAGVQDGEMKFVERTVVIDSRRVDTLLAIPL